MIWSSWLINIAKFLLICWLALAWFALIFANSMIFQPPSPGYDSDQVLWTTSSQGHRIAMHWYPHEKPKAVILYSHGNAQDLSSVAPTAKRLHDMGYSVLVYDYQGYGLSEGSPNEAHAHDDIMAAYRWLIEQQQVKPQAIVAFGFSLGASMAIYLAAHQPVGALIVQGGFVSAFRVLTVKKLLPWDRFDNLKWMDSITVPTLFMHGTDDEVVPFWHGKALFDVSKATKDHLWVEGADHNNLSEQFAKDFYQRIERFLDQHVSVPVGQSVG